MTGKEHSELGEECLKFAEIFRPCHAERRASHAKRDQRKSKHPENVSPAMQLQGVLFHAFLP